MSHKTIIINLIGPPGAGKTTIAALLFAKLKILGKKTEYAQEVAKTLVWAQRFDDLNNQHNVSNKQYKILKMINGNVEYIVTDGPLLNGLYYNRHNVNNVCDIKKTEEFIMKCYKKFDNINIYITRGNFEYEQAGRIETEQQSHEIEGMLRSILDEKNIKYQTFKINIDDTDRLIDEIITYIDSHSAKIYDPIKEIVDSVF